MRGIRGLHPFLLNESRGTSLEVLRPARHHGAWNHAANHVGACHRAMSYAFPAKQRGYRARENLEIGAERPVLQVLNVEPHHLFERELITSAHLP